MKVLFDHSSPFLLAHGGVQIQIEQTKAALARAGIDVDFLRWWDDAQPADIIHYFGSIPNNYLDHARQKRIPVVSTAYFSFTCNRSDVRLSIQRLVTRFALALPGWESVQKQLQWRAFREADHLVVGLEAERRVLEKVYGVPKSRVAVIPLGLDEIYLQPASKFRDENYLICVGTIRDVKRSVELAEMARRAEVPILFVGNPYSQSDPYWTRFQRLIDNRFVLHKPHTQDRAEMKRLYSSARAFVLFSRYENWSLVAHEAAASGLALLLPDLNWSRECFGNQATYFRGDEMKIETTILKEFYTIAPSLSAPQNGLYSWDEMAARLIAVYNNVLESARNPALPPTTS